MKKIPDAIEVETTKNILMMKKHLERDRIMHSITTVISRDTAGMIVIELGGVRHTLTNPEAIILYKQLSCFVSEIKEHPDKQIDTDQVERICTNCAKRNFCTVKEECIGDKDRIFFERR